MLIDFLNDEDMHIQIDAIEAATEIIDELSVQQIEEDFIPCILNFLDADNQSQSEIVQRISQLIGKIVYKLSKFNNQHLKYKKEFIEFFRLICDHKEDEVRYNAVYNLPCFNTIFKDQ